MKRPMPAIAHGGALSAAMARHGGWPEDWMDLSTGINPVPLTLPHLPSEVWGRLPDEGQVDEVRALARPFYGARLAPLPVPGTQAAIQRLPALIGQVGYRVAILGPTYGEYARAFERAGWQVMVVTHLEHIDPSFNAAVVVNPNNPDGRIVPRADLLALAKRLSGRGGRLIVDEAFADVSDEAGLACEIESESDPIILKSFGKFFGLAGVRLGFVIADAALMERLSDELGPWAVSGPALAAARHAFGDRTVAPAIRRFISARNAALLTVLERAGLDVLGNGGLFVLVHHPKAGQLHDGLCTRHILTRRFEAMPDRLRLGLTTDSAQDDRLAEALGAVLSQIGD
jgi:cobalamin biosynthesis protein CobC